MDPWGGISVRSALFDHRRKEDLGYYRSEFAEASADTVAGGADARGENFGGRDEGCCIGS